MSGKNIIENLINENEKTRKKLKLINKITITIAIFFNTLSAIIVSTKLELIIYKVWLFSLLILYIITTIVLYKVTTKEET
jgi:hypothetical protein